MAKLIEIVDWEELGFPQIPELLNNLFHSDPYKRGQSYSTIQRQIVFGGESFEDIGAGYGISLILKSDVHVFLIAALLSLLEQQHGTEVKYILSLLSEMADYVELKDTNELLRERIMLVRGAIWGGLEIYTHILQSNDTNHIESASNLLIKFPEYFTHLIPLYLQVLKGPIADTQKATLLWHMYQVFTHRHEMPYAFLKLLHQFLENSEHLTSKLTAAICLVDSLGGGAPEIAINLVSRFIVDLETNTDQNLPPGYSIARKAFGQI